MGNGEGADKQYLAHGLRLDFLVSNTMLGYIGVGKLGMADIGKSESERS